MRPGPRRKGRRFFPPIEVLDPEEFEARHPIILVGPDDSKGYVFSGRVELVPLIVPNPRSTNRPYLALAKTWDARPEIPRQAQDLVVSSGEFASEMRAQHLRIGIDKYGNGRVYLTREYAQWAALVGHPPGSGA